jgi:hypothetical protein
MTKPRAKPPYDVFAERPIDGDELGERMGETEEPEEEDTIIPQELP